MSYENNNQNENDEFDFDLDEMPGPVLFYNKVVIDHFTNPRNVGELEPAETDGYGLVGDPSCGDQMKLWISVKQGRIVKIAFKSFGCPGAIATSSILTALAQGKAIQDARKITDDDVIGALGGIPENKRHCSLLGVRALQAAIMDWERKASSGGSVNSDGLRDSDGSHDSDGLRDSDGSHDSGGSGNSGGSDGSGGAVDSKEAQ